MLHMATALTPIFRASSQAIWHMHRYQPFGEFVKRAGPDFQTRLNNVSNRLLRLESCTHRLELKTSWLEANSRHDSLSLQHRVDVQT